MWRKFFMLSVMASAIGLFSGCAAVLIGGVAGYEVSADSVKGNVDTSYDRAYDASLEAIRDMGGLSVDKKEEGWVRSDQDGYAVAVHVEELNKKILKNIIVLLRRDKL